MIYLLLSFSGKAQNSTSVTLNVNLYEVQKIVLNSSEKYIDLDYRTKEDYENGIQITEDDHLKVYSTGGFAIKVKSIASNLSNSLNNASSIDAADITVTATRGTTSGMEHFNSEMVQLSTSETKLISSGVGSKNNTFNINYSAKGDGKYVNMFFKTQSPTVYSTQVIYTIEPI